MSCATLASALRLVIKVIPRSLVWGGKTKFLTSYTQCRRNKFDSIGLEQVVHSHVVG